MKTQQPKVRYWHTSREYISLNRCEQLLCCVLCLLSSYYLPTYFCILLTQPMLDTQFDTVILGLIAIWYFILIMCYFYIFWIFSMGRELQKRKSINWLFINRQYVFALYNNGQSNSPSVYFEFVSLGLFTTCWTY